MKRFVSTLLVLGVAASVSAGNTPEYGQDLVVQYDNNASSSKPSAGSLFGLGDSVYDFGPWGRPDSKPLPPPRTRMPPWGWVDSLPEVLPFEPLPLLPPPKPILPPAPSSAPVHRVVKGDTLWGIASRYCGSGPKWKHVYDANQGKIANPHWIYPGQEFVVACGPSSQPRPPAPPVGPPTGGPRPPMPRPGNGNGNGPHRIQPEALTFAGYLPLDPGTYDVGQTIGAPRDGGRRKHEGIDLMAPRGTPIRAIGAGTVTRVGNIGGYGWVVYIKHPNGFETRYAHQDGRPPVQVGQRVQAGERIGSVGDSGNAAPGSYHIHFEVRNASGKPLDPHSICKFR